MLRFKKTISIILLFVFASLFAKNILPDNWRQESNDCDEIAHIHKFKLAPLALGFSLVTTETKKEIGDHDDCHAGKSIVSTVMFTGPNVDLGIGRVFFIYHTIFGIGPNFQSPYLDPVLKPPRPS